MSKIKGFIGETLIYGFGNVFSRLFAMLLIPLYAKFLGKIDYSNLVMLQSTFTILTFLLALNAGVFFYYYEYDNLRYRKIVFTSWFYYQLTIALFICITLFFSSPFLSNIFVVTPDNSEALRWCLVLVGVQLFPYIFNITNINYFRIERKPKKVVLLVLLEAIFTITFVTISLVVLKQGLISVLFSQILARTIVSLIYSKHSRIYINIKNFSRKILKKIYLYTWPFILSSIFTWVIISIDKFIGAQALTDKTEVALLALAMQLVLPISVLADMIRMALGPYVMSIRKEDDAEKSYQQIFDLVIFTSSFVVVGVIMISPLLTVVLADITYIEVIYVIPLMAFSKILALSANQFSISFNLLKKNIYILYAVIIAGVSGIIINMFFMKDFGYIVSGYSQIVSYILMATFLYFVGKRVAKLQLKLRNSFIVVGLVVVYISILHFIIPIVEDGKYLLFIGVSLAFLTAIFTIYIKQQKLNSITIVKSLLAKYLKRPRNAE